MQSITSSKKKKIRHENYYKVERMQWNQMVSPKEKNKRMHDPKCSLLFKSDKPLWGKNILPMVKISHFFP